jgi:hypothetical protein
MRRFTKSSEYCDQCCAGACQDCANEREASEGFFEKKGGESRVENEAGLDVISEMHGFQ